MIYDSSGHHAFCNSECLKRCKIISEDGKAVLITEIDGGLLELKDGWLSRRISEEYSDYTMTGIMPHLPGRPLRH